MDKELRILILEDSPADTELEEHELRKSGLVFTSKVVDTREAFLKEIDEFLPDLILSDYELPSFDGLAALRIAKEKCPDVPFILVTGKLGEEFVIDKLKDGATDYVLKNNLQRLVPAVNRALQGAEEITERKRLRKELQESEKLYRLLAENTHDMITRHLPDGTYLYVSPVCRTMFGYEPEELIGTNAFEQMHPDDVKRVMTITQEAVRTGRSNISQYRHRTKDGQYIWVETAGKVVKDETTGEIKDIICVVRDITDRKQAENEILKTKRDWENIFEAIGQPAIILDAEHNLISANRATLKTLKAHSEQEIKEKKCYELFHNTSEPPQGCPLEKMLTSGNLETVEMEIEAFGGVYLVSCTPVLDEKGNLQKVIHIATDITERKRAEGELQEAEQKFRIIFDNASDGILLADPETKRFYLGNKTICQKLMYSEEEIKNLGVQDIHPEEALPYVTEQFEKQTRREIELAKDIPIRRKDGSIFYADINSFPVIIAGKQYITGIFRDVTERKHAEDLLHNSEAFLNSIIEQSPYPLWISDDKGMLLRLNQACRDMLHITDDDVVGKYNVLKDNIVEEQGFMPLVKQVFEQGQAVRFNLEYNSSKLAHLALKDTTFVVLDVRIFPIKDLNGRVTNAVIQHINITEHKRAEREIKKRVKELEEFYEIAIGRELRMKDLKERIEGLEKELAKYKKQ